MNFVQFKSILNESLQQMSVSSITNEKIIIFLNILNKLNESTLIDNSIKFTQMTVLFEGFYQSIFNDLNLKSLLLNIRIQRWGNHYGTPTVLFLLTYENIISTAKLFFSEEFLDEESLLLLLSSSIENTIFDQINQIHVDIGSAAKIEMPQEEEIGKFTKTYNPKGGFATLPCDPVSQKFLEYSQSVSRVSASILEIGVGFGAASLQALIKGLTIYSNDIDPRNLAVVRSRYLNGVEENSLTGDDSSLVLLPGEFPDELSGLPQNFFDAILISRVMHFFTGTQIEKSLRILALFLKPGGKIFIVCETPFLKNWQKFIPEYERRIEEDIQWPGEINNPAEFESSGRAESLPKFVHWISKEVMEKVLISANFNIEHINYIDRNGQFPEDLLFDGRESIGAIAIKPF